jgi:uncharacterized protein YcfJ
MKTLVSVSLALAAAISLAACNTPEGQNAAGGAVVGGLGGALIGSAIDHGHVGGAGTLVGAVTGAAAGAMVASAATPRPVYVDGPPPPRRCAEFYYDYYGNRVCRAYY